MSTSVVKRSKLHKNTTSLGPCIYSPTYDAVEAKRDKSVKQWGVEGIL